MQTIRQVYRMAPHAIGFVKFIIEAHDNLAVMTTLDPRQGIVGLAIAPGCQDQLDEIMARLAVDVDMVRIERPHRDAAADSREERICR